MLQLKIPFKILVQDFEHREPAEFHCQFSWYLRPLFKLPFDVNCIAI